MSKLKGSGQSRPEYLQVTAEDLRRNLYKGAAVIVFSMLLTMALKQIRSPGIDLASSFENYLPGLCLMIGAALQYWGTIRLHEIKKNGVA